VGSVVIQLHAGESTPSLDRALEQNHLSFYLIFSFSKLRVYVRY